jgi:hypothetical protein
MGEKRQEQERTHKVAEELSKLQQIHAYIAALDHLAASYPEDHSMRLLIEFATRSQRPSYGKDSSIRGYAGRTRSVCSLCNHQLSMGRRLRLFPFHSSEEKGRWA